MARHAAARLSRGARSRPATIPATAFELANALSRADADARATPTSSPSDERSALDYLADDPDAGRRADAQLPGGAGARADRPPHVRRRLPVVRAQLLHAHRTRPRRCSTASLDAGRGTAIRALDRRARSCSATAARTADLGRSRCGRCVKSVHRLRLRDRVRSAEAWQPEAVRRGRSGRISPRRCGCSRSRGANSVEANDAERDPRGHRRADARADGAQRADPRGDGELHLHAHRRPRRRVSRPSPRAGWAWTGCRCCARGRSRFPARCRG